MGVHVMRALLLGVYSRTLWTPLEQVTAHGLCKFVLLALHYGGEGGNTAQNCQLHVAIRVMVLEYVYELNPRQDGSVLIMLSGDDGLDVHSNAHRCGQDADRAHR